MVIKVRFGKFYLVSAFKMNSLHGYGVGNKHFDDLPSLWNKVHFKLGHRNHIPPATRSTISISRPLHN